MAARRRLSTYILLSRGGLGFVATFLVATAPLWFAEYPPLHDFPFHIARINILAHWHESQALQSWYHIGSFMLPNVGMDIIAGAPGRILPVEVAGRLFVGLVLGLMLSGVMVLHRSIHGHFSPWPLVFRPRNNLII